MRLGQGSVQSYTWCLLLWQAPLLKADLVHLQLTHTPNDTSQNKHCHASVLGCLLVILSTRSAPYVTTVVLLLQIHLAIAVPGTR